MKTEEEVEEMLEKFSQLVTEDSSKEAIATQETLEWVMGYQSDDSIKEHLPK